MVPKRQLLLGITIMQLVAMNDDKHNDVWVSCYHGNGPSFGKVSQKVLFL